MSHHPSQEDESLAMFRRLHPELNEEELVEAKERFDAYADLVWRIYERVRQDPKEYRKLQQLLAEQETKTEQ